MRWNEQIGRDAVRVPDSNRATGDDLNMIELLEELLVLHKQELYLFCYRRLGDRDQAQDACGRIMLKAVNGIGSFVPHPHPPGATSRAWVFRIARNDLVDLQRTHRWTHWLDRVDHDGNRIFDPADPRRGPEAIVIANEADQRVRSMLRQLPDTQREIIELRLAGLRGDEIAQSLNMTLSAVKSAQYRAYQKLRELLTEESENRWTSQ